jgi:hypothetical protein
MGQNSRSRDRDTHPRGQLMTDTFQNVGIILNAVAILAIAWGLR